MSTAVLVDNPVTRNFQFDGIENFEVETLSLGKIQSDPNNIYILSHIYTYLFTKYEIY